MKCKKYVYDKGTGKMVEWIDPNVIQPIDSVKPADEFDQWFNGAFPGHEPGGPVLTGEPQLDVLDSERIQGLVYPIMELVRAHSRQGPASRDRVFESLNALAIAVGVILQACDDPEAVTFFSDALNTNIGDRRWH